MHYNTSEENLKLPQYGRIILQMVERALRITDRRARQAYAQRIIHVMAMVNPQMQATQGHLETLWNHLAYLSGYQLDVDYPCPLEHHEKDEHPKKLSYPGHRIRYRHYGHLVEQSLEKLCNMPNATPERALLTQQIVLRMKRNLEEWKGEDRDNAMRVGRDMANYTDDLINVDEAIAQLETIEERMRYIHRAPRNNRRGRR